MGHLPINYGDKLLFKKLSQKPFSETTQLNGKRDYKNLTVASVNFCSNFLPTQVGK